MDLLVEQLERFGLDRFVNEHRFTLCTRTLSPHQVAAFLQLNSDLIAIINAPPDNFSKNGKLYECIEKMARVKNFLDALKKTGNEHVIIFIRFAMANPSTCTKIHKIRTGIWFNIPEPIDSFCGREDFLSQLHDQLKPRDDSSTEVTVLSQVKIVSGLGGIGKTETARKYITKQRKFYNNFIWIDAETENSLTNSFFELADELKISVKNSEGKSRKIQEIVKEIYNKICEGGKSNLIVFDNAEDYLSCRQFFPFGLHPDLTKPVILATSRNQEWISATGKIQVLPLNKMTEDESLEFISKQLEIPESEIPELREESREFIELIGGLPLALQQAVAYIRQEKELQAFVGVQYKIGDYVKEFKLSMKKFQSFSPVPATDSSPTVYVTYNLTLLKLFNLLNGEEAIRILAHLSFLYADKIPSTFLHDLLPEIQDPEFSGALKLLKKYSLISSNSKDFSLSIHRQLQFVILQYLKESKDISKVVMNITEKCTGILKTINLSKSSDIFLNIHQIVNNPFDLIPVTEKFLDFMDEFGSGLNKASRYSESLELYKKLYKKRRELLGGNHEKTLSAQHQIALNLDQLGRYDEALTLYKEVLEQEEIHPELGLDHPETIGTKHNMANVLREQGKYEESLELFQQVLAHWNKILGEKHPETLSTQNAIALVHSELGDFSQALDLYEELEMKQIGILGPHHTHVLLTKHNKATVLFRMRQFQEASKIFNEVHEKQREILGQTHLHTIATLEWIAVILEEEGKFTQALDTRKKVYEIRKQHLGVDHHHTITTKHNIAAVLRLHGKYQEALEMFQQGFDQKNKILGENHPSTLSTQNVIALVHSDLGHFSQALDLFQDMEKKQMKILDPFHKDVLQTKHNKACVLYEIGQFEDASKILHEVHEKRKEILGETHLQTIDTLAWVGKILSKQGKVEEAVDIYNKIYEIRKANLGEDHPDTIEAFHLRTTMTF